MLRLYCSVPSWPFSCLSAASESGFCSSCDWRYGGRPTLWLWTLRQLKAKGLRSAMCIVSSAGLQTGMRAQTQKVKYILQEPCLFVTHIRLLRKTHKHTVPCVQATAPPLPLQVKRPTPKGHMTQPLAFLPVRLCISGVHETPRHPPLLSLAHARLLVAVAESRACQEPCLGATWNDKMRMRARGWHMVLISSQVYRGSLSTEHNQTYSQHPAHWTSSCKYRFPPRCHWSIWDRN